MESKPTIRRRILDALGSSSSTELKNLDSDFITDEISRHSLFTWFKITAKGDIRTIVIKVGNYETTNPCVVRTALERDMSFRKKLVEICPGVCPAIVHVDLDTGVAVEEYSALEVLQTLLLVESKVDHGFTCNIARVIANLHKSTHKENLKDAHFQALCTQFPDISVTDLIKERAFVEPFSLGNIPDDAHPRMKDLATSTLTSQQFLSAVAEMKDKFENQKDCLIFGDLNSANIRMNEQAVQVSDVSGCRVGPCAFDVGTLVAHYVIAHYSQMLTEQDNDFHRRISYEMTSAITKTMDTYTEGQTFLTEDFVSDVSGFAGVELTRRALMETDPSQVPLTASVREEIFRSGQRLLKARSRIDNVGRMLMIGLQLC